MAVSVPIYDWPDTVIPASQLFYVASTVKQGGVTPRGVLVNHPEPGGRGVVRCSFNSIAEAAVVDATWLMTMLGKAIFRVPVWHGKQTVDLLDIDPDLDPTIISRGVKWGNGGNGGVYWGNGFGWGVSSIGDGSVVGAFLEGVTQIVINLAGRNQALRRGKLFGIADVTYHVDAISYAGDVATVTFSPPLRADVTSGSKITFRPYMLVTARDPNGFRAEVDYGFLLQPGGIELFEVVL